MIKTCKVCGGLEHGQRTYMCECAIPKDEVRRYREALERIAFGCYPYEPGEAYTMQRIAREALGTSKVLTDAKIDAEPYSIDP